tara:strand:+ start:213 stop:533 length:321 start_codon:yes stop_codon:yes gene_type:complete
MKIDWDNCYWVEVQPTDGSETADINFDVEKRGDLWYLGADIDGGHFTECLVDSKVGLGYDTEEGAIKSGIYAALDWAITNFSDEGEEYKVNYSQNLDDYRDKALAS